MPSQIAPTKSTAREVSKVASGIDLHIYPSDPRVFELVGSSRPSPLELGRLRHDLMRDLRAELARVSIAGDVPGELTEAIIRAGRPRAPWQTLLARCIAGIRRDDYRFLPPSRKHIWRGIYLPSCGVPGPRLIVCAIDTSGSVGTSLAQKFLTEVHGLRSSAQCKIYVVQCDTRITKLTMYESWELPDSAPVESEFKGRGGTDYQPVFDWVQKDIIQREGAPDLLVFLTDGMGLYPQLPPSYPVVWLMPEGMNITPPFGSKIEIF
jgi:predicted metal-dependent peptidase